MRRRWMMAAIACVAAVAALWFMSTRSVQESKPLAAAPEAPVVAAKPVAPTPPTPVAPTITAPPGTWLPGNDVREHFDAAMAGDLDAMLRVGIALRACVEHLADPTAVKLREDHEREIAHLRRRNAPGDADNTGAYRNTNDRFARRSAMHADCLAIGAERVATGLHWIERAAHAGHPRAKAEFAREAFKDYPDANALLANLDEVARRRDLARAWAMQALEAGERGAVDVIARGYYGESPLFPRNLQQGAPYAMAQEMLGQRAVSPETFRRLYERGPDRETYGWGNDNAWVHDEAAWQAALARARAIVDLFPPNPQPRPVPPRR